MAQDLPTVSPAAAARPLYAGVDVGGTNIKFGLVDDTGRTLLSESIPTEQEKGPEDAVVRIAATIHQMIDQVDGLSPEDLAAVGLATPGTQDIPAGMILTPFNLPDWRHFAIRDALRDECGKPVAYANDANAAGYGEYWVGSGKAYPSMVMMTLGTGVGGGIILGDLVVDGAHSHGGELGHVIIDYNPDARPCTCGGTGHLEAYTSATAIVKRTEQLLASAGATSVRDRVAAGDSLTTLLLAEEAAKGDDFAWKIIEEAAEFIGIGIVTVAHLFDPSIVVLGGAVNFGGGESELGQRFLGCIRQSFRQRAFPVLAESTKIDFAELGGHAGYIGAAGIARVVHAKAQA